MIDGGVNGMISNILQRLENAEFYEYKFLCGKAYYVAFKAVRDN